MSDLTFSVADILGKPGRYKEVSLARPVPGVKTALCDLGERPVAVDIRAEAVVEGVLVTGRVKTRATCRCARCLEPVGSPLELDVCELYASSAHALDPDEDVYELDDRSVDLEPMLRDALTLALPLIPLCRRDCKGLCAGCGHDLNTSDCNCEAEASDPRWAELSSLRARLEAAER